ncbi:efflux RND transporter periplasmic adaptor subunit [Paracoccus sp. (in: a-proteobacteria)]|uniref:efflux RND transporter periplasmic adaptor subunit n=1 Tax=Paracoccus sp. TaxID=267 RepID=UPI003A83B540
MTLLRMATAMALALGIGAANAQDAGQAPAPAVTVAKAKKQSVASTVTFNGRLQADQSIQLIARVSGFLQEVGFNPGDQVEQGAVLFQIEQDQYSAAVRQAEGNLAAAEATVTDARIERDRQAELVRRNASAQTALDTAEAALGRALGNMEMAQAALDTANLNLSYTSVTAPFTGRIGERSVDPGALVDPQIGPLATLTKLDPIHVNFLVPTAQLRNTMDMIQSGEVKLDESVRIVLANGKEYESSGALDFIDSAVNPGTDSISVRATFSNPDGTLLHDELVRVHLAASSPAEELTIPLSSLQRDLVGEYVMLVDQDEKVQKRRIAVDRESGDLVIVDDGLAEGDRVISQGVNKVREGMAVDAAEAEAADQGTSQQNDDTPDQSGSEAKDG